MIIGIAQLNYHIGNFEKNISNIIEAIEEAKHHGVDLLLFSELSVSGYPPMDLLEREGFVNKCYQGIKQIASHCDTIAAIVGGPLKNPEYEGKNLFNSAFFLYEGEIKEIIHKSLLPTYDIFDEDRYFESNKDFKLIEIRL